MRKILLRQKDSNAWQHAEEAPFRNEAQLQELLYEDPSLIPFEDLGEGVVAPRVFVREAGLPGSGSTDLIGVDDAGSITVIECKLATNPEQKRKVVGQVLEYAAFLWRMEYDGFERLFEKECAASNAAGLAELVAPVDDAEWSEAEFRGNVESTLKNGDFCLVIAVDSLNDELQRIIEYLNRRQQEATTVCAVEVGYFTGDGFEALSPRILGPKTGDKKGTGANEKWDEARFFTAAAERCAPEVARKLRDLYHFSVKESDNCKWGRGKDGSFTFRLERAGVVGSVFSCFTSGSLMLSFGFMDDRVGEPEIQAFGEAVARLRGFSDLLSRIESRRWPRYDLAEVLDDAGDLDAFKSAVLRVRDSLGG